MSDDNDELEDFVYYDDDGDGGYFDDIEEDITDEIYYDDESNQVYTGDEDNEVVFCGDDSLCYHGGKCILVETANDAELLQMDLKYHSNDEKRVFGCTCPHSLSGVYSGSYCEYEVTSFCAPGSAGPVTFCVNEGTCSKLYTTLDDMSSIIHHPCKCKAGFEGDKCQYEKSSSSSLTVGIIFLSIATILIGLVIRRFRKKRVEMEPVGMVDYDDDGLGGEEDNERSSDKNELI